jgi:hypothetical protein
MFVPMPDPPRVTEALSRPDQPAAIALGGLVLFAAMLYAYGSFRKFLEKFNK